MRSWHLQAPLLFPMGGRKFPVFEWETVQSYPCDEDREVTSLRPLETCRVSNVGSEWVLLTFLCIESRKSPPHGPLGPWKTTINLPDLIFTGDTPREMSKTLRSSVFPVSHFLYWTIFLLSVSFDPPLLVNLSSVDPRWKKESRGGGSRFLVKRLVREGFWPTLFQIFVF